MKKILTILLLIFCINIYACKCGGLEFMKIYNQAYFIAKVKIIDFNKLNNSITKIETLELFKGEKAVQFINVELNSLCGISPKKNSIWLLFCKKDEKGNLITYRCSGSKQIDIQVDDSKYPNYIIDYQKKIDLTINVLKKLKKYAKNNNEFDLKIAYNSNETKLEIDDYRDVNKTFSIYELSINEDLKIKKVRTIIEFDNKELSKNMLQFINSKIIIDNSKINKIPRKTKLYLVYFFYNGNDKEKSILTFNLL